MTKTFVEVFNFVYEMGACGSPRRSSKMNRSARKQSSPGFSYAMATDLLGQRRWLNSRDCPRLSANGRFRGHDPAYPEVNLMSAILNLCVRVWLSIKKCELRESSVTSLREECCFRHEVDGCAFWFGGKPRLSNFGMSGDKIKSRPGPPHGCNVLFSRSRLLRSARRR
jgi:hypothetical protein